MLEPNSSSPSRTSGRDVLSAATTVIAAPAAPSNQPTVRAGRRPRRTATEASGTVTAAAPSVSITVAMPAHPDDPEMSLTRSAPIAMPAPLPSPPTTWVNDSTVTIRRWTVEVTPEPNA